MIPDDTRWYQMILDDTSPLAMTFASSTWGLSSQDSVCFIQFWSSPENWDKQINKTKEGPTDKLTIMGHINQTQELQGFRDLKKKRKTKTLGICHVTLWEILVRVGSTWETAAMFCRRTFFWSPFDGCDSWCQLFGSRKAKSPAAGRDSLRASAAYISWAAWLMRFSSSKVSMRSVFQTMVRSETPTSWRATVILLLVDPKSNQMGPNKLSYVRIYKQYV